MSVTLDIVEQAINRARAAWTAHDSPFARQLSTAEPATNLFGLSIDPEKLVEAKLAADAKDRGLVPIPLPPRIDWRDHDGACWLSEPRNQKNCGCCVAFATIACLEARARLVENHADPAIALSEADLFFCGGGTCHEGWHFDYALAYCKHPGVGLAADFPYTDRDQPCRPIDPVVRTRGHNNLSSPYARRHALLAGPVIGGMRIFDDFPYYSSGVYRHVAGDFRGYHAICIVGYDDDEQCWIVRNSWGSQFGEGGYIRVGYGECGLDTEFLFYAPDVRYNAEGFA